VLLLCALCGDPPCEGETPGDTAGARHLEGETGSVEAVAEAAAEAQRREVNRQVSCWLLTVFTGVYCSSYYYQAPALQACMQQLCSDMQYCRY
jgi:hypothetical protein